MEFKVKQVAKKYQAIEITAFHDDIFTLEKPGKRGKARIFCQDCNRWHHLHWGEFQNALKQGPQSLQDIIDIYGWKYCAR